MRARLKDTIRGSIPALITPIRGEAVDLPAFQALVARQAAAGTHGFVPCGTTGESPTLSDAEHASLIRACVEAADGRPVIAGCGSASTDHALRLMRAAKAAGADAALVVTPYYNRPSQEGLYRHYKALHDGADLPIIVYNVPARTSVDLAPETLGRLAGLANIVGVKDASRDLGRVARHRALCGEEFILLSGEDDTAVGFNALGGVGCISVTANVAPALCAEMQAATQAGDYDRARAINEKLADLHKALFIEPSPAPTKYALSLLGLCAPDIRLPLVELSEGAKAAVRAAMKRADLL